MYVRRDTGKLSGLHTLETSQMFVTLNALL